MKISFINWKLTHCHFFLLTLNENYTKFGICKFGLSFTKACKNGNLRLMWKKNYSTYIWFFWFFFSHSSIIQFAIPTWFPAIFVAKCFVCHKQQHLLCRSDPCTSTDMADVMLNQDCCHCHNLQATFQFTSVTKVL